MEQPNVEPDIDEDLFNEFIEYDPDGGSEVELSEDEDVTESSKVKDDIELMISVKTKLEKEEERKRNAIIEKSPTVMIQNFFGDRFKKPLQQFKILPVQVKTNHLQHLNKATEFSATGSIIRENTAGSSARNQKIQTLIDLQKSHTPKTSIFQKSKYQQAFNQVKTSTVKPSTTSYSPKIQEALTIKSSKIQEDISEFQEAFNRFKASQNAKRPIERFTAASTRIKKAAKLRSSIPGSPATETFTVSSKNQHTEECAVPSIKQEPVDYDEMETKDEPLESIIEIKQETFEPSEPAVPLYSRPEDHVKIREEQFEELQEEPLGDLVIDDLFRKSSGPKKPRYKHDRRAPKTKTYIFPTNCQLCDEILTDVNHFVDHTMQHSMDCSTQCSYCYRNFDTMAEMRQHEKIHANQEFHCPICGKTYKRKSHFNEHMGTHSTERKHVCNICGKAFKVARYLREHKMLHREERPYKCDLCPKLFRTKSESTQHLYGHETHRYQCRICPKKFRLKKHLEQHEFMHMKTATRIDENFLDIIPIDIES